MGGKRPGKKCPKSFFDKSPIGEKTNASFFFEKFISQILLLRTFLGSRSALERQRVVEDVLLAFIKDRQCV